MDESVEIRFDGKKFDKWQKVDIRTSVDDLCATVKLSVTKPGSGEPLGVTANTVIGIYIDDELVTTVRPDVVRRRVSKDSHTISIDGRSLGRELVDCQYSTVLSGLKLGEIAKRLCKTFKVPLTVDAETPIVPNFAMQGELPSNALINAARTANLLMYPQADGGLIMTEPTDEAAVATVEYGVHIQQYAISDEHRLRFSDYVVRSFDYDGGRQLRGAVKDPGITFFRPMHIVADRMSHGLGSCERRAQLERNRRAARAYSIDLELTGWRHGGGVWEINTQVRVVIPDEDIDDVFLIGDRVFALDDKGGRVTVLKVMPRNAFLGESKKKSKRKAGSASTSGSRMGVKK